MKFTGLETPQELRQGLLDCSDLMLEELLLLTKDQGKIEQFLLVKTFHNEILEKMAEDDPYPTPHGSGKLLS